MSQDFRSDRMESADGRGIARRAWESYSKAVNTAAQPIARKWAAATAVDLMGFWLVWHLHGGYDGLRSLGMSRSAIYRRTALFRRALGQHPDEFQMPGVELDLEAYWSWQQTQSQKLD